MPRANIRSYFVKREGEKTSVEGKEAAAAGHQQSTSTQLVQERGESHEQDQRTIASSSRTVVRHQRQQRDVNVNWPTEQKEEAGLEASSSRKANSRGHKSGALIEKNMERKSETGQKNQPRRTIRSIFVSRGKNEALAAQSSIAADETSPVPLLGIATMEPGENGRRRRNPCALFFSLPCILLTLLIVVAVLLLMLAIGHHLLLGRNQGNDRPKEVTSAEQSIGENAISKELVKLDKQPDPSMSLEWRFLQASESGNLDLVQSMLANWEPTELGAHKALVIAACRGQLNMVQVLIKAGVNVKAKGGEPEEGTVLHCAAKFGRIETAKALMEEGKANANSVDNSKGWTPLHFAAQFGQAEMVSLLLSKGANATVKDSDGRTALDLAAEMGHSEVVALLLAKWKGIEVADVDEAIGRAGGNELPERETETVELLREFRRGMEPGKMVEEMDQAKRRAEEHRQTTLDHHLFAAVDSGNPELVAAVLDNGAQVNSHRSSDGNTAMHMAAQRGRTEIAELLLKRGADAKARNKEGKLALHLAAENGEPEIIGILLSGDKANVKAKDERGWTALHYAVEKEHKRTVEQLIGQWEDIGQAEMESALDIVDRGNGSDWRTLIPLLTKWEQMQLDPARIQRYKKWIVLDLLAVGGNADLLINEHILLDKPIDRHGNTLLHYAVWAGNSKLIEQLIAKGADANARNVDGENALHWAALMGREKAAGRLLAGRGDKYVDTRTPEGGTALQYAVDDQRREKVLQKLREGELVEHLLVKLAKPPFLGTVAKEQVDAVLKRLLGFGANVREREAEGRTALHFAAKSGRVDALELLLRHWPDISADELDSVVKSAAEGQSQAHFEAVEMLLKAREELAQRQIFWPIGAEREANANLHSPLSGKLLKAAKQGNTALVGSLLDQPGAAGIIRARNAYGNSALHLASTYGHLKTVELLLARGADVMARNSKQQTALYYAACEGKDSVVLALVQAAADVNAKGIDGETALHCASEEGWEEVQRLLLENGADVNARNTRGYTPLHWAAQYGKRNAVRTLLSQRADVKAKATSHRVTPLQLAAQEGHHQVVRSLLEQGRADAEERDRMGWTALHYAARYRKAECVKVLLEHWKGDLSARDSASLFALLDDRDENRVKELLTHKVLP